MAHPWRVLAASMAEPHPTRPTLRLRNGTPDLALRCRPSGVKGGCGAAPQVSILEIFSNIDPSVFSCALEQAFPHLKYLLAGQRRDVAY